MVRFIEQTGNKKVCVKQQEEVRRQYSALLYRVQFWFDNRQTNRASKIGNICTPPPPPPHHTTIKPKHKKQKKKKQNTTKNNNTHKKIKFPAYYGT